MTTPERRTFEVKKVSAVNAAINTLLAIFKIIVGYLGNSHALIADGIHSFSDLITDALVLFTALAGSRSPDKEHPYGHQRIETIGAIVISLILIVVAVGIAYDSIQQVFLQKTSPVPDMAVLLVALVSVLANEGLYRYTLFIGKKIESNLLITNAWHNRSDAFVSLIVVASVVGSMLGAHYLDTIGAILIAAFILKMGIKMMWRGVRELIDTAVDEDTLQKIRTITLETPGVLSVHQLRTRLHGDNVFVDMHILVNPFISVSEGHHIGERVHLHLVKGIKQVSDVTVHIDPEDDEVSMPSLDLPSRKHLHEILKTYWENLPGYVSIKKMTLHYLEGQLYIEVFMPANVVTHDQQAALIAQYRDAAKHVNNVASITIHFTHGTTRELRM